MSAWLGGGLHTSFSIPHLGKVIAGSAGIELVSFLSETHEFPDAQTGLRVQQETNQDYFRFYLGPEIGPRGPGFFRPHLGVHLAFVNYGISLYTWRALGSASGTSIHPGCCVKWALGAISTSRSIAREVASSTRSSRR